MQGLRTTIETKGIVRLEGLREFHTQPRRQITSRANNPETDTWNSVSYDEQLRVLGYMVDLHGEESQNIV